MRNVKKFLALVLAMLMVVSAAATVSAFEDVAEDNLFAEAIADLTVLEIVNGYDGETFGPEDAVTRQQFALMMARAITGIVGDDAVWAQGGLVGFEDVTEYQYAIATVVKAGIVDGFLDNTFRPDEGVTFIQALKMAVAALGYDDGNLDWWQGYYNVALDLGLTVNLNQITDADKALNRGEVAQLIWNMLYAPSANGSSLYEDIFAEPVEEPAELTTFAIVATPKQCATLTTGVAEGGYVGLQKLVNGVPAGDIVYIAIDEFDEFDADTVENFFGYAYDFANWNDGEYDDIIATGTVDVLYNTEITEADSKITIDGKNYYVVEEFTGTPIRNELIVFNADNHEYVHTAKILLLDKYDRITNKAGDTVLKAVYNTKGDIIAYQAFYAPDGTELETSKIYDEAKATELYGTDVESAVDALEFLTAKDLNAADAYQLTVFDDDMDGKLDRAYYTPVWVSAYNPKDSGGETFGPMNDVKNVVYVDEAGETVTFEKGDVFKYTWNDQLDKVTVLDTYGIEKGLVSRINTRKDNSTNNYVITMTIDGQTYTLANSKREAADLQGYAIYDNDVAVSALANLVGKDNEGNKFNDGLATINYTYNNNAALISIDVGDLVRYLLVDGEIVMIEDYDVDEVFDLAVVEDIVDYDLEAVYLDMWINGELEEDVAVTKIWDDEEKEYVTLADLNVFKLYNFVGEFSKNIKGNIYRLIEAEDDTYQISEAFVNAEADRKQLTKTVGDDVKIIANKFDLAYVASTLEMKFDDGIGDFVGYPGDEYPNNELVLRTDDDTLFYFLKKDGAEIDDIYTFEGIPADGATLNLAKVQVYANKLGFEDSRTTEKNGIAGTADVVVVYYESVADIKGFGITNVGEKIVYMAWNGDTAEHDSYIRPSDRASASDLELGREYTGMYYVYSGDYGVNMQSGAIVSTIYSKDEIYAGKWYVLSNDNVVIDEYKGYTATSKVLTTDIVLDRFKKVNNIFGYDADVDYVYFVDADNTTKAAVVADASLLAKDNTYTLTYVPSDLSDHIFVAVVSGKTAVVNTPSTVPVTGSNAQYSYNQGAVTCVANNDLALGTAGVAGKVTTYTAEGAIGTTVDKAVQNKALKDAEDTTYAVTALYEFVPGTGWKGIAVNGGLKLDAACADGVVTISKIVYGGATNRVYDFVDGTTYKMEFVMSADDYGTENIQFIVEFEA